MEEILDKTEGLFFIDDNVTFKINDIKRGGEFPNFYKLSTDKTTVQLFTKEDEIYSNSITSRILKVNKNICIYIPYAKTALTVTLKKSSDDAALLHGEEVEIEYYKIYKGVD